MYKLLPKSHYHDCVDDFNEKAALAMIGGEGDFYIGGLPSETNLLQNHPEDFKLIGGAEDPWSSWSVVQQHHSHTEVAG